jgi:TDG/mug DNA glycosylase family protein
MCLSSKCAPSAIARTSTNRRRLTPTKQRGLDPVAARTARFLVLGSFPGTESLRVGEYYAFSRNRFWRMIERIFDVDATQSYSHRTRRIKQHGIGIALWDSLHSCVRRGALDREIVRGTERPNDFRSFLGRYTGIRAIVFNGRTAEATFHRLVKPGLSSRLRELSFATAPSTSPANTRYSLDALESAWRTALQV